MSNVNNLEETHPNTACSPKISNGPNDGMSWSTPRSYKWTKDFKTSSDANNVTTNQYIISTDPDLIPLKSLTEAFDQEFFYWGRALPEPEMQRILSSSLCFGLYVTTSDGQASSESTACDATDPELSLIGFARLVTDCVTVGYLTDFYVLPGYQGAGLGTWLLRCIEEVTDAWPYLRRIMFFTNSERSRLYYERVFRSRALGAEGKTFFMERPGPARPASLVPQAAESELEQELIDFAS